VPLQVPPSDLSTLKLKTSAIAVSRLFRVSRHATGEPYFGRSGANRFDDPARGYGTCYCGFDLQTAIAETVLHDLQPTGAIYAVSQADFESRYLVRFTGTELKMVVFHGVAAKTLAGDGTISTVMPYGLPQQWSEAIHDHPDQFDGILYMSRQVNDRKAAVVFDRAAKAFTGCKATDLKSAPGVAAAKASLGISFAFP
jgi:hypothetical protein